MVFDRITLINIYDTLKLSQDNDGHVSNILLNRSSKYGTKTMPRFRDLEHLKEFINEKYPYIISNECGCLTKNEGIWNTLAFEVYSKPVDLKSDLVEENNKRRDIKLQPASKHATFVNNMRREQESQKKEFQNKIGVRKTDQAFKENTLLSKLFKGFVCLPYIEDAGNYINPCDYVETVKNDSYDTIISEYYKPTRRKDFPTQTFLF